jgi:hypothetical protein
MNVLHKSGTREWITPLTMGAFVLSAITGVLLFFKMKLGYVKLVHEWLSWLFIISAVIHIFVNRKALISYCLKPLAQIIHK